MSIGTDNAVALKGRLTDGFAKEGPYDAILIEGAVETVPDQILAQMSGEGRLVAVWRPDGPPGRRGKPLEQGWRRLFTHALVRCPGACFLTNSAQNRNLSFNEPLAR